MSATATYSRPAFLSTVLASLFRTRQQVDISPVKPTITAKEMIGRTGRVHTSVVQRRPMRVTTDTTQADYEFFDKAENGLAEGLEIAGLFLKPIRSKIAAWTLGDKPAFEIEAAPETQDELNRWMDTHWHEVLKAYSQAVGKGDFWVLVNPDLTLTLLPPHIMESIVDERDYTKRLGWRTYERINHPTEPGRYQLHINEYYDDRRVQTIESDQGFILNKKTYPNLIGRSPIIHIPNATGANQVYGTPEAYPLVSNRAALLYEYNEMLRAGVDGNIRQGRSTPTIKFNDIEALSKFFEENATRTEVGENEDGTPRYEYVVEFDADKLMMVVGDFDYKQPGAFAGETQTLAGLLYWIILEHTEIPEFVMGTAVASSKASTETQMPVWERYIRLKQGETRGWLTELAEVVRAFLVARRDVTGAGGDISITFKSIIGEDDKLMLEVLKWLKLENLIDDEEALTQAPAVVIKDVTATLKKAKSEAEEKQAEAIQFDAALTKATENSADSEDEEVPLEAAA